jgi:hypothetical protein
MSKAAYFASGNRATERSPATSRRASQVPLERMSKRLSDSPLERDPDDEEAADYKEPTDAEAGEVNELNYVEKARGCRNKVAD